MAKAIGHEIGLVDLFLRGNILFTVKKKAMMYHLAIRRREKEERKTYKDGSNFLADQSGRRGNIIVGHKVQIVLDIFNTQRHADADTKGTVIVHVQRGNIIPNHTRRLFKAGGAGCGRRHGGYQ